MKKAGLFYRFKVAALLLAIFLITPNGLAYAQEDQIILCPNNEVTAGIMTPLPEDWWNTPQIGRLSGVQIRQLGGEPLLTCLYKAYGKEIAVMRRPPETGMKCQTRSSGLSFVCKSAETLTVSSELQGKICQASIQNQIEWDYEGRKRWARANLEKVCKNAYYSLQPGVCFNRVMHGNISHGAGTRWKWPQALKLCASTQNANSTITCFTDEINQNKPWTEAIEQCRVKQ